MNADAVVLGAELDALVAALRLRQLGHSVRLLSTGAGSLHYATAGIRVLGYLPGTETKTLRSPLESIDALDIRHPYRRAGSQTTCGALEWFFATIATLDIHFRRNGINVQAITPAGFELPIYATDQHQATWECVENKRVTLIHFHRHHDFPVALVARALTERACAVSTIETDGPSTRVDTMSLARAFDAIDNPESYFADIKPHLATNTELAVFPCVLGITRQRAVIAAAEQSLGVRCLELPTLPPSVAGLRLHLALQYLLQQNQVPIHTGGRVRGVPEGADHHVAVVDGLGHRYSGSVFVLATGGILMGGLEVAPTGHILESVFGLDVFQSRPLSRQTVGRSLDALQLAGIEVDHRSRAENGTRGVCENLFVSGRTLAHWNPASELSAEGVSIVTGWMAAQSAHDYLDS